MKFINIVVEGSSEENFVDDVLVPHFAQMDMYVSARRILTGWDRQGNKPAKGGLRRYISFRKDVHNWIKADRGRANTFYTSLVDLYAFPKDAESPFTSEIQAMGDKYEKIKSLEEAIAKDINDPRFIPYVQLHEFEAFLLVEPDLLTVMYPGCERAVKKLKDDIGDTAPELVNESPETAPSKRIIKYFPEYGDQKAQVGPMVASDIGLNKLRKNCPHFDEWITKLESL